MSFVLVKSFLFPETHSRYSPLPSHSGDCNAQHTKRESSADDRKADSLAARVSPRIISDATIGLADGLTVPFALTAGLSALGDTRVVIYGGLAELIAGGISMGLGGYLGAKSETEAYQTALVDTQRIVARDQSKAVHMVRSTFDDYRLDSAALDKIAEDLLREPSQMVDFLMRFNRQLAEAEYTTARAYISGLTISAGYFFGGLTPLLPYLFVADVKTAFYSSVAVMILALFLFGWFKTSLLGETSQTACLKNGAQMVVLGGVAALAAMTCVSSIGG